MSKQIHNFFQGSLYISEGYLDALVPLYFKSITSTIPDEGRSVEELETQSISISSAKMGSSDIDPVEDSTKVAIINFIGPVVKYSDWWMDMLGTQDYMRILDRFKNDPSFAGVVLNVDSGGGQKYGTPQFYDYIKDFKEVKPIVVHTHGLLCSGAYYFSCPASYVIANKRADAIGSIGIYTELFDWNGYYESFGLKVHTIYSDLSDEKNKSHRDVIDGKDPEYKNYIKKELNPDGQQFIDDMKAARPQIDEKCFKGGTWNGEDSLKMGLIDANGTLQDAVDKVFELSKNENNENNNNPKNQKETMAKTKKAFPVIQKLIGVEGEGLDTVATLTGKVGIKISEEELGVIEDNLAGAAQAIEAAETAQTEAEEAVTTMENAIDAAIEAAGLTKEVAADATADDKITLLSTKVVELGKAPAVIATKPKSDGDTTEADPADASTSIVESITK